MNYTDTGKLFCLLRQFYPWSDRYSGELAQRAWWLALEPYSYRDVRGAALEAARRSPRPPTVGELIGYLPGDVSRGDWQFMMEGIAFTREWAKRRKADNSPVPTGIQIL